MNLHKLYIPAVAILGGFIIYGVYTYMQEREARVRAEEQDKATKALVAQKTQDMADRDKAFKDFSDQINQRIANIKTPAQAATILQPIIQMPAGQTALPTVQKQDLPKDIQATIPNIAPTAKVNILTDQQVEDLAKAKLECDKTTKDRDTCKQDLDSETGKFVSMQQDRDKWQQAAKGGSWLRRTLRVGVPIVCAGGGAWLASKASKSDSRAVAIGALVGGGGCAATFRF